MNLDLTGKKALVCGSTQGLGLASAIELALLGCSIVLFARNEESLKETLATLDTTKKQQHSYLVSWNLKTNPMKNVRLVDFYMQIFDG